MNVSRKKFIKQSTLALASLPLSLSAFGREIQQNKFDHIPVISESVNSLRFNKRNPIVIFSKHLQWLQYKDMAKFVAELGFDGVDLTVREGGHVSPDRVTIDLPKAVEAIRNEGLEVYTITTEITDASGQYTLDILRTMNELGINHYRMGWYKYSKGLGVLSEVKRIEKQFATIASLNQKYNVHGDYENHTNLFGSSLWDLWLVIKDLDPKNIGCQFDLRHATIDGAAAWPINLNLLHKFIGSITIKDFYWRKVINEWQVENVPLGEGMVNFDQFFKLLKTYGLDVPVSLHIEYPLGGAESGASEVTLPKDQMFSAIKKDLETLRKILTENGL